MGPEDRSGGYTVAQETLGLCLSCRELGTGEEWFWMPYLGMSMSPRGGHVPWLLCLG
jgi:hypothetical protein